MGESEPMNPEIEIKVLDGGQVYARRKERQPLTPEDRQLLKALRAAAKPQEGTASPGGPPGTINIDQILRAWVVEEVRGENGELRAALICSALLDDHLWVIRDRTFEPMDGLAIYYDGEMPLLRGKSLEELRKIHEVKLEFPGCRIVQEGAE